MKKITLITALMIGFTTVKADHQRSELNLKMFDNSAFTVTFDNSVYNVPMAGAFGIGNLMPGRHFMRVAKVMPRHYGHGPIGMQRPVFSGYIDIPVNAKVFAMIDFHYNYAVQNIMPNYVEPVCKHHKGCGHGLDEYMHEDDCDRGQGKGHGKGKGWDKGDRYDDRGDKGWDKGGCHQPVCMSQADFCSLKSSIANRPFDSSRLMIAKQAISTNYMSAAQVTELVDMMTFETSKLELAKFAYQYTIDKGNYYKVNDAFTFDSSVRELMNFISKVG